MNGESTWLKMEALAQSYQARGVFDDPSDWLSEMADFMRRHDQPMPERAVKLLEKFDRRQAPQTAYPLRAEPAGRQ